MRLRLANGEAAVDTDFAWKIKKKRGADARGGCRFHGIVGRPNVLSNKLIVISIDQGQEHDWRSDLLIYHILLSVLQMSLG